MIRTVDRAVKRDPNFLRKVFVSHYCQIPFERLDVTTHAILSKTEVIPDTLLKELYMACVHTMRAFELAPYTPVKDNVEDYVRDLMKQGKL